MIKKQIPLYKLSTKTKSSVYGSGKWVDGTQMALLKSQLEEYLGVKHVILTNNGTSALLAAYWVLRHEFNKITVDPYTFPATYQPARVLGYSTHFVNTQFNAKVVFSKKNLNVVTHLFGQPHQAIEKLKGKPFIEDACQAFGAELNGQKVGTFGLFGCFSFYPTKSLHTCGHGGALVTNDDTLYQQASLFINSGRDQGKMTSAIALNLRMDEIKAEFLLNELRTYDKKINQQIQIAQNFKKNVPTVAQPFLHCQDNDRHIYSVFNLLVENRDLFREFMAKKKIATLVYYGDDMLPTSEKKVYQPITSRVVAIPCRWNLTREEIVLITNALKEWFYG